MSMKNSNYIIVNRTRDFPACGAVPEPTAPPRAPYEMGTEVFFPGVKETGAWNSLSPRTTTVNMHGAYATAPPTPSKHVVY
jgi:hypothetical protein